MIPTGTFAQMLEVAQSGDGLFFWDKAPISYVIEDMTAAYVNGVKEVGPSHIAALSKLTPYTPQWMIFEAVFEPGCRLIPASHYANNPCKMLLTRRAGVMPADVAHATEFWLNCLGRQYDWREEVEAAWRILSGHGKVMKTENEMFCSGYYSGGYDGTSVAYGCPPFGDRAPMFLLQDVKTVPVMWVNA